MRETVMQTTTKALAKAGAAIAAGALSLGTSSAAWAVAQEPTISGDKWVAYGIIGGLILAILLFVLASVGIASKDAAYEKGHKHHNVLPGVPMLGEEEDG